MSNFGTFQPWFGCYNRLMNALSKRQFRRRVAALCELQGIDLGDLDSVTAVRGLPVGAAKRAGHESDKYQPNHALNLVLAEYFDVPVEWFENEEWRGLINTEPPLPPQAVAAMKRQETQVAMLTEATETLRRLEALMQDRELEELEADEEAVAEPPETSGGRSSAPRHGNGKS